MNIANKLKNISNEALLRMHVFAFVGFMGGVKLCDYIFYDEQPYLEMQEDMEEEFWAKNGEPKLIEPYIVPSYKNGTPRKSWIYIMYDKDKIIKKKDYID